MASGASRQDLRHVSPFSSGSGRRLAIAPQLLAQPGAIDHPPRSCSPSDSCAEDWELRCGRGDTSGQISTLQTVQDLLETRAGGFRGDG